MRSYTSVRPQPSMSATSSTVRRARLEPSRSGLSIRASPCVAESTGGCDEPLVAVVNPQNPRLEGDVGHKSPRVDPSASRDASSDEEDDGWPSYERALAEAPDPIEP